MKLFVNIILIISVISLSSCSNNRLGTEKQITTQQIIDQITEPEITGKTLLVNDFGAKGDSVSDNKRSFDKAINAIKQQGGGHLIVPAGVYQVNGPIHLTSNMNLHLEEGAVLRFGSNPADYLPVVKTSWEGTFLYNYSPFIYARECENISITGNGVIDGEAANTWQLWKEKQEKSQQLSRDMNHKRTPVEERIFGEGHYLRPHLIQFFDCKNIKVENVKMEDSPFWCLHLLRCESVIVRGVRYEAHNKNNDGIDPEMSRNVLIEDVHFNNGDDNVAIKAGRDDDGRKSEIGSENIVVRNCQFQGLHALVIGSEMSAGVQNVFVQDCSFGGNLKRGIYLKSNPDRGGFIRNLYVENVDFGQTVDCIYITSYYHNEGEGHQTDISNIHFKNITCNEATGTAIVIQGFPEKKVRDVYFTNIEIKKAKNALSMENTENIVMSDILIGKLATAPSLVQ
jgi:polygalacturonase